MDAVPSAPYLSGAAREWFLVPHDRLFAWVEERHGLAPKWDRHWSYPSIGKDLATYLAGWRLAAPDPNSDRFVYTGGGKIYQDGVLVADLDADPSSDI